MNIEELKARLRKLKALADRGEGGERVELVEQSSTIRTGTKAKKEAKR